MNIQVACSGFLDYCRLEKHLALNTLAAYKQDLDEFRSFCGTSTHCVSGDDLIRYAQHLREIRKLSPTTIKRRLACLRALFNSLVRQSVISSSPFAQVSLRITIPKRLPRCLGQDELKVLASATASARDTTRLATLLLFATGVRVSELASVRVGDIDLEQRTVRILGKGSRERQVFLPNELLATLVRDYVSKHHGAPKLTDRLLLNRRKEPASAACLRARLKNLASNAGIPRRVTPHMLRHTAATSLLEAGVDIRFVQRLLGHQSIATTQIYTHVSDVALKLAIANANVCRSFPGMDTLHP
jgi:site-specific recombinase XerD